MRRLPLYSPGEVLASTQTGQVGTCLPECSSRQSKELDRPLNPMSGELPVLLVIFNRPDHTRRAVEALRQTRPARLFVAADGPRPSRPEDIEKCRLARQAGTEIDWPCEVKTRFLNENAGCGPAVSSAMTWFFEHVEHSIILEDEFACTACLFAARLEYRLRPMRGQAVHKCQNTQD